MSDFPTTAMITGASAGLGRAIASKLAASVQKLVLVARREALLEELAAELRPSGVEVECQTCDLGDPERVEALATHVGVCEPPLNVLVNCAGIQQTVPFVMHKPPDWANLFQVNVHAPLRLTQAFAKRLRRAKQPGCVVNIASAAAFVAVPNAAVYCATKGALVAAGRALAAEWAGSGIRIITICPGFVRTDMLEQTRRLLPAEAAQKLEEAYPLGLGEPQDVAELVEAVLGPAGRWMTGNSIVLDGGYTAV